MSAPRRQGRRLRAWCAANCAGLVLLAGCATVPSAPPSSDLLSGRLAVLVDPTADAPARSESAAFELRGTTERGELTLTSPLGTVIAQARWRPGDVVLQRSNGEQHYATLSALAAEVFGDPLPLQALVDWLHGRPWPQAPSQPLAAPAAGFEQLGWTVSLDRWGEGLLVAHRASAPGVTVRAKLTPLSAS